jgi:predicted SprT family Zn-dependent metalloprotease
MTNQSNQFINQTEKQYTQDFYTSFQIAYNIFNKELFNLELPQCFITLNRKKNIQGFFCPQAFTESTDSLNFIAEISLNPDYLVKPIKETLSTLVHEMCHLWCDVQGYKARKGFHSKEWGNKMLEVGLQPINAKTGEKAISGAKMNDEIIVGDLFDTVCDKLLKEVSFNLVNIPVTEVKKEREKTKFKYFCPDCDAEFSGKRDLNVLCGNCDGSKFEMEE